MYIILVLEVTKGLCDISCSHGGEYEDYVLLVYSAV
jgi:hypothetical protein